jgi:tetratricopeptide (TPR) repeat protein
MVQIKDFSDGLRISTGPENLNYLYSRGESCLAVRYYQNAINDFSEAILIQAKVNGSSRFPDAYIGRGKAYLGTANPEFAIKDFTEAHTQSPYDDGKFNNNLGLTYLTMRKAAEAITAYNAALKDNPNFSEREEYATSLYGRGEAELMLNDPTAAKADMDAARRINPNIQADFQFQGRS